MLVVDASIVVDGLIAPSGLAPLQVEDLVAPPLLWSEAVSTIRRLHAQDLLTSASADAALEGLLRAPIIRLLPDQLYREALRVAAQLGWVRTYDAEYVALARLTGARLLTRDARLARGARALATVIGPADL